MAKKRLTDFEIVESIFGKANGLEARGQDDAAQNQSDSSATYDTWSEISPTLSLESDKIRAMRERVQSNIERELPRRAERFAQPAKAQLRQWLKTRETAAVAILCACGVAVVIGYVFLTSPTPARPDIPGNLSVAENVTGQAQGPMDTSRDDLVGMIQSLNEGDTLKVHGNINLGASAETVRITKALRIEAATGPVRIGEP